VLGTGLALRGAVEELGMRPPVKTSGSEGLHLYVPIVRGPVQKKVRGFAKRLAQELERRHPRLITTQFYVANRPRGRVLVDYNRMPGAARWLRCTRCVRRRSPAPRRRSAGRKWSGDFEIADFRLENLPARVRRRGDLWKPLLSARGRFMPQEVL
jgi:bifunctional non-homologous end joining protein LigD